MKITIKDIAKMAGVSHPTVSKALNNEPGVSEETRRKILTIAKQVNYVPNLAAKRLVHKKTNSIGLIWPQAEGLFFYHLCSNLQKEASAKGLNVIISLARPEEALRTFNQHFVDMVIAWLPPEWVPSTEFLKEKENLAGQMLVMGGANIARAHRILIDRKKGISLAIKYLSDIGHKRVAFVGQKSDKLIGYMQGIVECGLEYIPEYSIVEGKDESGAGSIEDRVRALFDLTPKVTALVADSNGMLFQLIKVLRKYHICIPEDLSIIAYDDIPEMEIFDIPITTIGPSIKRLTESALNILTEKRDDSSCSYTEWVEVNIVPELVVRQSTRKVDRLHI